MSKARNQRRSFSKYIDRRVGSMRLDSGFNLKSADMAALNLVSKIATWEQYIAGASNPTWKSSFMHVGNADRVIVNMVLADGSGSQFKMSLGSIRNSGGGLSLEKAIWRAAAGADVRRDTDGKRVTIRDIRESVGFRFRIDDGKLY